MTLTPLGDLPRVYADQRPGDAKALIYPDGQRTWQELEHQASQRAAMLRSLGVREGDFVTIALPNGVLFHETTFAVWKCGAVPNVVSSKLPKHEFQAIVELVQPKLIVGGDPAMLPGFQCIPSDIDIAGFSHESRPAPVSPHWKAMTSGGSTGRPKVIVDHSPATIDLSPLSPEKSVLDLGNINLFILAMRMQPGMVMLNPGPMYHNGPFMMSHLALFLGCQVIGSSRFDAEEALRLIEQHKINWIMMVPTMMHRIWSLPAETRNKYDISSLQVIWHMAAPMPVWLKKNWIDWVGPEKIWELYGGTEAIGGTVISGAEWLEKPGSVGRPPDASRMRIVGEDGRPLGPNEIGEVQLLIDASKPPSHYIGAETVATAGGWQSLGDIGYLDQDGYLFLADRRTDLILRGGANIYPAEIESALDAHPDVGSSVVVGLPCDELGQRVHAIVQPRNAEAVDIADLHEFLTTRLAKYKLPESYEFVDAPLRDDAGKVRRNAFRDERLSWTREGRKFQLTPT